MDGDHRHVVDVDTQSLRCTCRDCALLFDGTASNRRYRAVPDRYLRLDPFALDARQWSAPVEGRGRSGG